MISQYLLQIHAKKLSDLPSISSALMLLSSAFVVVFGRVGLSIEEGFTSSLFSSSHLKTLNVLSLRGLFDAFRGLDDVIEFVSQ